MDEDYVSRRNCLIEILSGYDTLKPNGQSVEGVNVVDAIRRYESRYFSRKTVPAGRPSWRIFCNPDSYRDRRKIKLSWLQHLSGAEVTNLAD